MVVSQISWPRIFPSSVARLSASANSFNARSASPRPRYAHPIFPRAASCRSRPPSSIAALSADRDQSRASSYRSSWSIVTPRFSSAFASNHRSDLLCANSRHLRKARLASKNCPCSNARTPCALSTPPHSELASFKQRISAPASLSIAAEKLWSRAKATVSIVSFRISSSWEICDDDSVERSRREASYDPRHSMTSASSNWNSAAHLGFVCRNCR